jgi:hypothetical protein
VDQGVEEYLPSSWAADLGAPLGAWVEEGRVGARLWPGAVPDLQVVDLTGGAGLALTMAGARLEVTARVVGTELVLLRFDGSLKATLRVETSGPQGPRLGLVNAHFDSSEVASPLLKRSGVALAKATLAAVVEAAVRGILAPLPAFSDGIALDGAPVVVGSTRVGQSLWLWLDGGVPLARP